jgi:hypothetical protein
VHFDVRRCRGPVSGSTPWKSLEVNSVERVRVVTAEQKPFLPARDLRDGDGSGSYEPSSEEIDGSSVRYHHPGSAEEPQLFEVRVDPYVVVKSHAHAEDEIIAVVEGELHLGAKICRVGSSIFVRGNTLYGFTAGPHGVRFLNFRPRMDNFYWTKAAVMARRGGASSSG